MSYFIVQRDLPGITQEAFAAAGLRAKTCSVEMAEEGTEVRWVRSFLLPKTEQSYCVFEGPSAEVVAEMNERSQIPFKSITEVLHYTPDMV